MTKVTSAHRFQKLLKCFALFEFASAKAQTVRLFKKTKYGMGDDEPLTLLSQSIPLHNGQKAWDDILSSEGRNKVSKAEQSKKKWVHYIEEASCTAHLLLTLSLSTQQMSS